MALNEKTNIATLWSVENAGLYMSIVNNVAIYDAISYFVSFYIETVLSKIFALNQVT